MNNKQIRIVVFLVLLISFIFRLSTFFTSHIENDEVIYTTLIKKDQFQLEKYSLQNTVILEKLPAIVYDYSVFHHPPLFVYLGKIIYQIWGERFLMLVPVVSSLATVYLVFKISKRLTNKNNSLFAMLFMAICPVNLFVSSKLWIDSFLTFLITLSFYFSLKSEEYKFLLLSGLFSLLSLFTKLPAVFILPAILVNIWQSNKVIKQKIFKILLFMFLISLIIFWFLYYMSKTGQFFPNTHTRKIVQEMFPFVKKAANRPFYFYFTQTLLLSPLSYLFILNLKKINKKKYLSIIIWNLSFFIGLTFFHVQGGSAQMRYILPALPGLAILTSVSLPKEKTSFLLMSIVIGIVYQIFTGLINTYTLVTADLIPILYIFN